MTDHSTKYLPADAVSARYGGITRKTLHAWINGGSFPQPVKIAGRNYWPVAALDEHDAKLKTEKGSGPRRRAVSSPVIGEAA